MSCWGRLDEVTSDEQLALPGLGPHEVSRVHAKTCRVQDGSEWITTIFDLDSQCGTYVNGERIAAEDGRKLEHGDVVALGASHTSTYLFVEVHDA